MRAPARLPARAAATFVAAAWASALPAQLDTAVVPQAYASQEAPGTEFWALSPFEARRQLLVGEAHLVPLRGRMLWGITLRRTMGDPSWMVGGELGLDVWLSHSPSNADFPSAVFAHNRGREQRLVFSGPVLIPDSPPTSTAPAPWAEPYVVHIPFSKPFFYLGGVLCIETVTRPPPATGPVRIPWWTTDAVVQDASGAVDLLGTSCIPDMPGTPAGAQPGGLTPGGAASVFLRGPRRTGSAVAFLGRDDRRMGSLDLPLDLSPLGAPGCVLYTDWVWAQPAAIQVLPMAFAGHAAVSWFAPADTALVGGVVFSQWMVLDPTANPMGLTFSNGVRLTLGSVGTSLGMGWVEATEAQAAEGRVLPRRGPVMRFLLGRP